MRFHNGLMLLLSMLSYTGFGQQWVAFADSLEERSEVNRIKNPVEYETSHGILTFTKMKMEERAMKNFEIQVERFDDPETALKNRQLRVPLYILRYMIDGTVIGDPLYTNANFLQRDHFSYQLIGPGSNTVRVSGVREALQIFWSVHRKNVTVSNVKTDTSYMSADLILNDEQEPCRVDALFEGDDRNTTIGGIAIFRGDTLFIRSTNKAKKYHVLGIEVSYHNKVIAGAQLPDLHIGPSYSAVDTSLPDDLKNMAYAILSVIVYTNENRRIENW